jgi:hypothetical protein
MFSISLWRRWPPTRAVGREYHDHVDLLVVADVDELSVCGRHGPSMRIA